MTRMTRPERSGMSSAEKDVLGPESLSPKNEETVSLIMRGIASIVEDGR